MDSQNVSIRRLAESDVSAISAILQESPQAAKWSDQSLLQLGSKLGSGEATSWVAESGGVVAGFLVGRHAADEFEILNMAVFPALRKRGIGSDLLQSALDYALSAAIARVYLEVRASNEAAIALYARHGFSQCGRRAAYYREPVEDALLFSLVIDNRRAQSII